MSENTVNVVKIDRVVLWVDGVATDRPYQFNPETGTCAIRNSATSDEVFDAGFVAGFWQGQQLPQETIDRMMMQLPILDVNDAEQLDEDGGLFG